MYEHSEPGSRTSSLDPRRICRATGPHRKRDTFQGLTENEGVRLQRIRLLRKIERLAISRHVLLAVRNVQAMDDRISSRLTNDRCKSQIDGRRVERLQLGRCKRVDYDIACLQRRHDVIITEDQAAWTWRSAARTRINREPESVSSVGSTHTLVPSCSTANLVARRKWPPPSALKSRLSTRSETLTPSIPTTLTVTSFGNIPSPVISQRMRTWST